MYDKMMLLISSSLIIINDRKNNKKLYLKTWRGFDSTRLDSIADSTRMQKTNRVGTLINRFKNMNHLVTLLRTFLINSEMTFVTK